MFSNNNLPSDGRAKGNPSLGDILNKWVDLYRSESGFSCGLFIGRGKSRVAVLERLLSNMPEEELGKFLLTSLVHEDGKAFWGTSERFKFRLAQGLNEYFARNAPHFFTGGITQVIHRVKTDHEGLCLLPSLEKLFQEGDASDLKRESYTPANYQQMLWMPFYLSGKRLSHLFKYKVLGVLMRYLEQCHLGASAKTSVYHYIKEVAASTLGDAAFMEKIVRDFFTASNDVQASMSSGCWGGGIEVLRYQLAQLLIEQLGYQNEVAEQVSLAKQAFMESTGVSRCFPFYFDAASAKESATFKVLSVAWAEHVRVKASTPERLRQRLS